jgi:hypothetical protein
MSKNRLPPEPPEEEYVPHTKPRTVAEIWAEFEDIWAELPEHEKKRMKQVFYSGMQSLLWDFELIPNKDTDPDAVDEQVGKWYDEVVEVEANLIMDSIRKIEIEKRRGKPGNN